MRSSRISRVGVGIIGMALWILAAGCLSRPVPAPAPPLPQTVQVVGSSDMAPWVQKARIRAQRHVPPVELFYTPTDTTIGLHLLQAGRADVALASWLPQGPPAGYLTDSLGQDAIAIIVHPGVQLATLDLDLLRHIFSGRYLTWSALGGAHIPLRLVSREKGSGTRAAFEHKVMGKEPVALTAVVMATAQDVVTYVARHDGAIGYVSWRLVNSRVRVVAVNGILPTESNLQTGVYPLKREVFALFSPDAVSLQSFWK